MVQVHCISRSQELKSNIILQKCFFSNYQDWSGPYDTSNNMAASFFLCFFFFCVCVGGGGGGGLGEGEGEGVWLIFPLDFPLPRLFKQ